MEEVSYFSRDFDWNELRNEVEKTQQDVSCANNVGVKEDGRSFTSDTLEERRYLLKEFPELARQDKNTKNITVLEVGCGAGSSVIPIVRATKGARVYACDISDAAVRLTKSAAEAALNISPEEAESRLSTFVCDPSRNSLPAWLACEDCRAASFRSRKCCRGGVDYITLIFTLSAFGELDRMKKLVEECSSVLRPGGMLFFRDYGLYDMTMLRFPPDQKLATNCYRRLDGTLSYFFSREAVRDLFTAAGLLEIELEYCCIKLLNHKTKVPMKRVWIHAKFMKPEEAT